MTITPAGTNPSMKKSRLALIWRLMEGQRLRYGMAIGALVLGSCVLYLVPLVPQVVLDGVLAADPTKASPFVGRVVTLAGGREFLRGQLWLAGLAVLLLSATSGLLTYLRGRWSTLASEAIARGLRLKLYERLQHLPCAWHDQAATGDTVQRCTSDVETFRQFLSGQVVEIGRAVFMMLVPVPLMLALDARMTLVSLAVVPPIVIFALFFFRRVRASFLRVDEAEGRMTSALQENLTGIRVVRAFARAEHEQGRFDERNRVHRDFDNRLYVLMAWFWSSSDLLCMAQNGLVLGTGGYWLATGRLQVGEFYFFLAAVNLFIWPVRMMGRILTETGKATVAIGRIAEILEQPVEDAPVEPANLMARGDLPGAEVVFDRVRFRHGEGEPVLSDISFRVQPGETLALLGPSGSGKSTIVNLLLRFYDPQAGSVTIDGVDISRVERKGVRSSIAVVMQEPFLYSKTVGENIRFGKAGAPDEEVTRAAQVAAVHESIVGFEGGYGALVGERGVTLSGGQRQRVALARALLRQTPILVLDDALSAVDTDTESDIIEALRRTSGRQTTIVIAHRLSTLAHADRIVVLDRGRIVQQGTHAELMMEDGLYRHLWEHQSELSEGFADDLRLAAVTGE
jgi:ATP-binding cassette, subfamily B, bacterial